MQPFLLRKLGKPGYQLISILALFVICVVVGTLFYYFVEGLRPIDSLYFTVMTLTTVGYGDFAPVTDAGKIFTYVLTTATRYGATGPG